MLTLTGTTKVKESAFSADHLY